MTRAHLSMPFRAMVVLAAIIIMTGFIAPLHAPEPAAQDADWTARLTALAPTDTAAYLKLAEEVADAATSDDERDLARHLFRLAGAMDDARYGRSAALALADLAITDADKRTWLALATLLDRRSVMPAWNARLEDDAAVEPDRALALCNAFSYYRLGRGERVLQLDREHNLESLLYRFSRQIGDPDRFLEDARLYQRGSKQPRMSDAVLVDMLRLEVALLSGARSSWSADRLLNGGDILVEVNPDNPAQAFGVDPSMAYYRNGRWTSRP